MSSLDWPALTSNQYYNSDTPRNFFVAVFLLGIAQFHSAIQYISIDSKSELFYDASVRWLPIAQQLANGDVLYVTTTWDNKTPLWHALNFLVYLTGEYILVFYLLVGFANATVAYLMWLYCRRAGFPRTGLIAPLLFLSVLPTLYVDIINVRSFSLIFVLLALLDDSPVKRGVYIAIAVLLSQVSVVALPLIWLDGIQDNEPLPWTVRYVLAGSLVAVLPFLVVGLLWSPDTAITAVQESFFGAGGYFGDHRFESLYGWVRYQTYKTRAMIHIIAPLSLSLIYMFAEPSIRSWNRYTLAVALAGVFYITALLKALAYYYAPVIVFGSIAVAVAFGHYIATENEFAT